MSTAEQRVIIILGDNFDSDVFHGIKDCLSSAGINVAVAASKNDKELIDNKGNELIRPDIDIEHIPDFRFNAIVLSDGSVDDDLRTDQDFLELIRREHDAGTILAAIDTSVRYFVDAGIAENHSMTGSPEARYELETHGARYENEPAWVDGNLVTGRILEDLSAFCRVLVEEIRLRSAA
ncbi:MAG: DJ-1/PfpI family protein [Firmicutes bacterium]|nr:DJ-1/PfpI family protein [Bacillota bacterium]